MLGRSCLADAGFPGQHEELSPPTKYRVQARAQLVELVLSADKDAAGGRLRGGEIWSRPFGRGRGQRRDAAQGFAHLGCRLGSFCRRFGEQPKNELFEICGDLGVLPRRRDGLAVQMLREDGGRLLTDERRLAGQHLVDDGADRIQVGPSVDGVTDD